jgi:DNA-binding NarL/FixJ family response regulator
MKSKILDHSYLLPSVSSWSRKMSKLSDESAILIVDPLPLRNLALVSVLDRLSPSRKFRVVSLVPNDAEKWIHSDGMYSMIIYNVGGASVDDHKHLKRIKALQARLAEVPLVIFSDNNSRSEVLAALNAGAQGFLYAGTDVHLAQQALSFILEGGSYFSAARARRGRPARAPPAIINDTRAEAARSADDAGASEDPVAAKATNIDLTKQQKAVLECLRRGDSNKTIARQLGIREATVKVHVQRIMRKLGVVNRTQAAIACASRAGVDERPDEGGVRGKMELSSGDGQFGGRFAEPGTSPNPFVRLRRLVS